MEKGALSILSDKEVEGDGTLAQRAFHLFRKPRLSKQVGDYSFTASEAIEKLYSGRSLALGPDWFSRPQSEFGDLDEWAKSTLSEARSYRAKQEPSTRMLRFPTEKDLLNVVRHGSIQDLVNMAFLICNEDVPPSLADSLDKGEGAKGKGEESEGGEGSMPSEDGEDGDEPVDLFDDVEEDKENPSEWTPESTGGGGTSYGDTTEYPNLHTISILNLKQIPVTLEVPTKSAVEVSSSAGRNTLRYVGSPSNRIWQANYGNFRVFNKPTRSQPRVMLFVDLSGSMRCWCKPCQISLRPGVRLSNGYLAFQAAAAISAVHPKTEVFGFCSVHDGSRNPQNKIVPLKPGYSPECRDKISTPNGNNDCSMLLWLEGQMKGQEQDTVAIVISDGQPAGLCNNPHTAELARKFVDRGMKLASILIGTDHRLYPAEVSAYVNSLSDMANIWPVLSFVASQER